MNKNDLIAHVADAASLTKGDAVKVIDAVLDGIAAALDAKPRRRHDQLADS